MVSCLLGPPLMDLCFRKSLGTIKIFDKLRDHPRPRNKFEEIKFSEKFGVVGSTKTKTLHQSSSTLCKQVFLQKSVLPLAASIALLLWSTPANAGFLSGLAGIESVPGPELPQIDFLNRFNKENQKRYAENDARFKDSALLRQLLEQSKLNKEKNKQEIQDKYCIRGAEWGVGDCSAEGMSPQERDEFIAMLKKKAGVE